MNKPKRARSDAELALSRLRDFCGQHGWDGEPALSALRPLLDKVREARKRIADLEAERNAREAKLAEMRREMEAEAFLNQIEAIDADDLEIYFDRYAIPTAPPEEKNDE